MISSREILSSLYGTWRLAHLDPQGMGWFNLSAEGFQRSFFAAVLVLPAYLGALALDSALSGEPGPDWGVKLAFYPVYWLTLPIVLGIAARALGLGRGYAAAVIASNWAGVLVNGVLLGLAVIAATGLFGNLGTVIYLIAYMAGLFYAWFILRTALETTGGIAAALTAICELVNLLVQKVASLFG